jgi:hypothetical protein
MRILFVVDGRSPIALNWISYFIQREHEVHLASTFSCEPPEGLASFHMTPVAFSEAKATGKSFSPGGRPSAEKSLLWRAGLVGFRTRLRQWLGPVTFQGASRRLAQVIRQVQPDLIHAMRIPYEGIMAAMAVELTPPPQPPLLISVWGNDFTLHCPRHP